MKYYKRNWDENREGEFSGWGKSIWYVEVDQEGYPTRQIEKYENGNILKYDTANSNDGYGGLGDQALDPDEFAEFEIAAKEFNKEWGQGLNDTKATS